MKHNSEESFASFRRTGDATALGVVVDREGPGLLRIALHLTGHPSDAEDLVQETLLIAMESAERWDDSRPLRPWLVGILTHRARLARTSAAQTPDPERLEHRATRPPEDWVVELELNEEVDAAIHELPAPCQPVVVLRLKHHLAVAEIANALKRPPGTVRSQLQRGLEKLRRRLPKSYASALVTLGGRPERGLDAIREAVVSKAELVTATALPSAGVSGALLMKFVAAALVVGLVSAVGFILFGSDRETESDTARPILASGSRLPIDAAERVFAPLAPVRYAVHASTIVPAVVELPAAARSTLGTGELIIRIVHEESLMPAEGYIASVEPFGERPAFSDPEIVRMNVNGEARVADLPEGDTYVRVLRGSEGPARIVAGETAVIELHAWSGVTAEVHVVDQAGRPVVKAGVWISERFKSNRGRTIAQTDDDGNATIPSLTHTHYVAAFAHGYAASLLTPISGEPGSTQRVKLILDEAGGALSGTVTDDAGTPIDGARVVLGPEAPTRWQRASDGSSNFGPPLQQTHSEADGSFSATSLDTGPLRVVVRATGFAPHVGSVEIEAHGEAGVQVVLTPEARIVGRAFDSDGKPLASAQVTTLPIGRLDGTTTYTDSSGAFALAGLGAGNIELEVTHPSAGRVVTELQLDAGEFATWNPILDAVPHLHGTVLDRDGVPSESWAVVLTRPDDKSVRLRATTDPNGQFTITGLDNGAYRLWVQEADGWMHFPHLIVDDIHKGGPITLRLPDLTSTTAILVGEVAHADGSRVTDGMITLWHNERRLWREYALDDDGAFRVEAVPPGTLSIEVHASDAPWKPLRDYVVVAGDLLNLGRIVLSEGGRVSGRLLGPVQALEQLTIQLTRSDGSEGGVITRSGAEYESYLLAPGDYSITLVGSDLESESVSVTIAPGETVTHDLWFAIAGEH